MSCCLMALSHYLNQCWPIISEVLWHSHEHYFTGNTQNISPWYEFENHQFEITSTSPRGQWINMASTCPVHNEGCQRSLHLVMSWYLMMVHGYQKALVCQQRHVFFIVPDSKVHGANMGPIWGQQDPDGPHVGPHEPCYPGCFGHHWYQINVTTFFSKTSNETSPDSFEGRNDIVDM